jgi:hypothetical protein
VKPYEYGEGYEHLKSRRISQDSTNKIMNFSLRTKDIRGAQPDTFGNRESTRRAKKNLLRLSKGQIKNNDCTSFLSQRQSLEVDRSQLLVNERNSNYAGSPQNIEKKCRRNYINHKNNYITHKFNGGDQDSA